MILPPDVIIIGFDDDTWEPLIAYKNQKGDNHNESEQKDHTDAEERGGSA